MEAQTQKYRHWKRLTADNQYRKKEADYTEAVDAALPAALQLAQKGNVQQAVESLLPLEKQSRTVLYIGILFHASIYR